MPRSRILAAVDSVAYPNLLFQSTVIKSHDLKHAGMAEILECMGNPAHPYLFFVVPKGQTYRDFIKKQPYAAPGGTHAVVNVNANVGRVEQYALELPLLTSIVAKFAT